MKIINTLIFGILLIGLTYSIITFLKTEPQNVETSIILSAFELESDPLLRALDEPIDLTEQYVYCEKVTEGSLHGSNVVIVTTGMGKVQSALCTEELLESSKLTINEVIFSGIAGISPSINNKPVMLGDTCISSLAVDFASQHYSSDQGNGISYPTYWDNEFGTITSTTKGDIVLARELYTSSLLLAPSTISPSLAEIIKDYHPEVIPNRSWGPEVCIETTDDLFWHDTTADKSARFIGSRWINESLKTKTTANDIIVTTAMESAAVSATIQRWNSKNDSTIRFAYVRGASNYDMPPTKNGDALISGKESMLLRNKDDGNKYAANAAASVVLKMFDIRNSLE